MGTMFGITKKAGGRLMRWSCLGVSKPSMPVVVSYYTDLFYLRDAFELARTCQQFKLDFVIEQVPDLGSWEANTGYKPSFLLEKHKQFPDRPLVWVDADARFRRAPDLFDGLSASLAYHHLQAKHPLSGTVYLGVPSRLQFLTFWIHYVKSCQLETDQNCMEMALEAMPKAFAFAELPGDYCWIFDYDGKRSVDELTVDYSPVIEHMQASRWAKRLKAGKK